jgi:hypothetical protein
MLLTPPGAEIPLPDDYGLPGGAAWRLVENLASGVFVALVSADSFSTPAPRTLIMCWDSDLVHFLQSKIMSTKIHALHHIGRVMRNGRPTQHAREITTIWRGADRAAGNCEVIIFEATDGSEFCGLDAIPVPISVEVMELVVRIRPSLS